MVGVLAALFVIICVMKPKRWTRHLRKRGFWGAALAMERALAPKLQTLANERETN